DPADDLVQLAAGDAGDTRARCDRRGAHVRVGDLLPGGHRCRYHQHRDLVVGALVQRGAGHDAGPDQGHGQEDHDRPAAPRQAAQGHRTARTVVPVGQQVRLGVEGGAVARAQVAGAHWPPPVTSAWPSATRMPNVVVWVSGGLIAPPAPPDPVQLAVQVTVTEVWYWLRG